MGYARAASDLTIRAMTSAEFAAYRARSIRDYAAEHVRAGEWTPEQAEELAAKETDELLPNGVHTAGMALLVGEAAGETVGLVWVGLMPAPRVGWWIFDIHVIPDQRGRGYGRLLLEAAEHEITSRGGDSVGLNVFAGNTVARGLYESAGYEVTAIHMRKSLAG
jgi:ribosomal protein S18 acetylase RimI-like enzyme